MFVWGDGVVLLLLCSHNLLTACLAVVWQGSYRSCQGSGSHNWSASFAASIVDAMSPLLLP